MITICDTENRGDVHGLMVKPIGAELQKVIRQEISEQLPSYVQAELARSQCDFIAELRQTFASCVAEIKETTPKFNQTPENWNEVKDESNCDEKINQLLSAIPEVESKAGEAKGSEMNTDESLRPETLMISLQALKGRIDVLWEIVFTEIRARREAIVAVGGTSRSQTNSMDVEPVRESANASTNGTSLPARMLSTGSHRVLQGGSLLCPAASGSPSTCLQHSTYLTMAPGILLKSENTSLPSPGGSPRHALQCRQPSTDVSHRSSAMQQFSVTSAGSASGSSFGVVPSDSPQRRSSMPTFTNVAIFEQGSTGNGNGVASSEVGQYDYRRALSPPMRVRPSLPTRPLPLFQPH